jgi:hypothetical protein
MTKKKERLGHEAEQEGDGAVVRLWHWSTRRKRSVRWRGGAEAQRSGSGSRWCGAMARPWAASARWCSAAVVLHMVWSSEAGARRSEGGAVVADWEWRKERWLQAS